MIEVSGKILGKKVEYLDIVNFCTENGTDFSGSYLGTETVNGSREHVFINNLATNADSSMFRMSERYLKKSNIKVNIIHV